MTHIIEPKLCNECNAVVIANTPKKKCDVCIARIAQREAHAAEKRQLYRDLTVLLVVCLLVAGVGIGIAAAQ